MFPRPSNPFVIVVISTPVMTISKMLHYVIIAFDRRRCGRNAVQNSLSINKKPGGVFLY